MKKVNLKYGSEAIMGRLYLLISVFVLFINMQINAATYQDLTVTGQVKSSDDGSPLPGVNVLLKGEQGGTITDVDGRYSIQVTDANSVLIFSYVGFATEEISVAGRSIIDVDMAVDITSLQEVVVTALGIKREEK